MSTTADLCLWRARARPAGPEDVGPPPRRTVERQRMGWAALREGAEGGFLPALSAWGCQQLAILLSSIQPNVCAVE